MESTPKKSKGQRKVYLINPRFQLRVISYALFLAVTTILVFYISNLFFFWKITDIGTRLNLPVEHPFFEFVMEQKHFMNSVFLFTAVVVFFVIALSGLIWSHKIAGPIYRLQTHLTGIVRDGKYKKLTFRKGDSFSELAGSVNDALEALRDGKVKS